MAARRQHENVPDADVLADVLVERRVRTRPPRMFRVLLHNDDYTTMDFVVAVLERHFGRSRADSVRIMLQVHHQGVGLAGVYPRDVAETKVAEVTDAAEQAGMPLLVTAEPEPEDPDGERPEE